MKVTKSIISQIRHAMKERKLSQTALSPKVGMDASNISRLLSGKIKSMEEDTVSAFNDALGLDLEPIRVVGGKASSTALALTRAAEENEALAMLLDNLLEVVRHQKDQLSGAQKDAIAEVARRQSEDTSHTQ